ncbi:MAG: glycerate dehydrogenase [Gammaproteobacteria bacterium]|jgi:glycerate dehydrogenase|nr:glycerate dehydrogenase [Gammaproteobacteria bacterium]
MKAVLLDWATMGPDLDISELQALLPTLEIYDDTDDDQMAERIAGAEIVLGNKVLLSEALFDAAPEMRFIGLTATGTDNVDLVAAKDRGIAVCNIRAYCTQSVAEHVFACLLGLAHSLQAYSADVRKGAWLEADNFCMLNYPIRELSAMTLGIVGYGELGKGVANIARAFDMEVIVATRPGTEEIPDGRVSMDELLRRADAISLHCPLNDVTRKLFGADEFAAMKKTALLINTARGGLVDSQALVNALQEGEIAAAAVDVLPQEPPVNGDPLLDYKGDNLMITPHIAWGTLTARQAAIDELTANIAAFLEGKERCRVV